MFKQLAISAFALSALSTSAVAQPRHHQESESHFIVHDPYIPDASLAIYGTLINGAKYQESVSPNARLTVEFEAFASCLNCRGPETPHVLIGFKDEPSARSCQPLRSNARSPERVAFTMAAPDHVDHYEIYAQGVTARSCAEAMQRWDNPSRRGSEGAAIGVLTVDGPMGHGPSHGGRPHGAHADQTLDHLNRVYDQLLRLNPRERDFDRKREDLIQDARKLSNLLANPAPHRQARISKAIVRVVADTPKLQPISPQQFKEFKRDIDNAGLDQSKVQVLFDGLKLGYSFNGSQAAELVKLIKFSEPQLKAAVELCNRTHEPGAYNMIARNIIFGKDRDELRRLTGGVCEIR